MTPRHEVRRGRPLDPAVGEAVLAATLQLLAERGYEGLRVADVAARAGAGLGALYRRWPTKRELVLAAFASLAVSHPSTSRDPTGELLAQLTEIASAIAGPEARMMASILVGADRELADALRQAKLEPQLARLRESLQALIGEVPDLEVRVETGPALITFRALVLGRTVTDRELREEILPQVLSAR